MRKFFGLMLIAFTLSCGTKNNKLAEVDAHIQALHLNGKFDGTISIGNRNGLIYSKAFGMADRGWNIPMGADVRLDIASINKSFQAYMILQLTQQGILDLDDKLSDLIPYTGPHADQISIHQILTHTSGLPSYEAIDDSLKKDNYKVFKRMSFSADDYVSFISQLQPVSEPGKQFYYSNFGYHLLAIILEKKSGKHFSQLLDSMICKPLGLNNTYSPANNAALYERIASSYLPVGQEFTKSPFIDYSLGRRIFSTSEDLQKWAREMMEPTLISDDLHASMLSNQIGQLNPDISYGYGWAVFDGKGDYQMGKMDLSGRYILHGGATDGYRSLLTMYEDGEWIISHLSNIGDRVNELQLTEDLLKILIE